jgi:hypothetical protein
MIKKFYYGSELSENESMELQMTVTQSNELFISIEDENNYDGVSTVLDLETAKELLRDLIFYVEQMEKNNENMLKMQNRKNIN